MRQVAGQLRNARAGRANDFMAVPRPVVALARDLPPSHEIDWHSHPRFQLVYAARGVMTVDTREATWVVPPQRAVWMPPRVEHRLTANSAGPAHSIQWDCHLFFIGNRSEKNLVRGIFQLSEAIGLADKLPAGLKQMLSALFAYRNSMFHLITGHSYGFEVNFSWQTTGKKIWQRVYDDPVIGWHV